MISVKIEKSSNPLPATSIGEGKAHAPAAKADSAQTGGTSVHLGAAAAQLQSMENSMADSPLVNEAKVAEIKQAISEGRFQVNSRAVADSLIKTVNDLISASKA